MRTMNKIADLIVLSKEKGGLTKNPKFDSLHVFNLSAAVYINYNYTAFMTFLRVRMNACSGQVT